MLLRGFIEAVMMRTQQAIGDSIRAAILPPEHFDQIFSSHGTIMIFFMAMPFLIGLINYRRAAADRRPRRRFPVPELDQPLADGRRAPAW